MRFSPVLRQGFLDAAKSATDEHQKIASIGAFILCGGFLAGWAAKTTFIDSRDIEQEDKKLRAKARKEAAALQQQSDKK